MNAVDTLQWNDHTPIRYWSENQEVAEIQNILWRIALWHTQILFGHLITRWDDDDFEVLTVTGDPSGNAEQTAEFLRIFLYE